MQNSHLRVLFSQHLKNVPFSLCLHNVLWKIHCHSNFFSSLGRYHLFQCSQNCPFPLVFKNLIMMCSSVYFLKFILSGGSAHLVSVRLCLLLNLESFQSSKFLAPPSPPPFPSTSVTQMLDFSLYSHREPAYFPPSSSLFQMDNF